jgi:hypothetical protein
MIGYLQVPSGWSIADFPDDNWPDKLLWWCGPKHRFVSPFSSYWAMEPHCWNVIFPSLPAARRFARKEGFERHG